MANNGSCGKKNGTERSILIGERERTREVYRRIVIDGSRRWCRAIVADCPEWTIVYHYTAHQTRRQARREHGAYTKVERAKGMVALARAALHCSAGGMTGLVCL